jgi:nitroreductase
MDAITAIMSRTSVRSFRSDSVDRALIEELLECAVRAPNHKLTQPWRFAVLTGAARDRLGEIRAAHRLKRFDDPTSAEALASAEKQRRETRQTPVVIAAMAKTSTDELTREEDYAATMMGLANLMIAAQSRGLGTYLRTGGVMKDPALQDLAEVPDQYRIVGLVSVGYPANEEMPRRRTSALELTRWVEG